MLTFSPTVASERIEIDEVLFVIPRSAVLNVENSKLAQLCPNIPAADDGQWHVLILAIMLELSLGKSSRWKPYLDILPTKFDTLMYWSADEQKELDGCDILQRIGKDEAEAMFRKKVLNFVRSNRELFSVGDLDEIQLERYVINRAHWTASAVMAYAFDLDPRVRSSSVASEVEGNQELPKGMVPMADMLNADGDRNNVSFSTLEFSGPYEIAA